MNYEPSDIPPHESWNESERWLWAKLCRGEEADFNKEPEFGTTDTDAGWDPRRGISPAFLLAIALNDPWRGAINSRGVRIVGAWIRQPLKFTDKPLDHELALEFCRFDAPVEMGGLHTAHTLSLSHSRFAETLDMEKIKTAKSVHLRGATFGGEVRMPDARIGGSLDMKGARFQGAVDMEKIHVAGSLLLAGALFEDAALLAAARIAGKLNLAGARLCGVDMSRAHIEGEMRLGRENGLRTSWCKDARLLLGDAFAAAIVDSPDAWPEHLHLDGFVYGSITGDAGGGAMAQREVAWLKWWLRRHRPFSPQPYKQLAQALDKAGLPDKARDIRHAATEETGRFKLSEINVG
ncbi:MAG: pentapeptide repeat-containing protein [Nitrospinae bacterium]|nr:pentapeptide repeat-containing protein [Nitrospinota bacterium]